MKQFRNIIFSFLLFCFTEQAEVYGVVQSYEIYAVVGESAISNIDLDYFAKANEILLQKAIKRDAKLLNAIINAHLANIALQRLGLQLSEQELNLVLKKIEEEHRQYKNISIHELLTEKNLPFSEFKKVVNLQISGEKLFKMSESFQKISEREKECYMRFGISNYAIMRMGEISSVLAINEMFGVKVSKTFRLSENSLISFHQLMIRKDLLTNSLLTEIAQQYKKSNSIDEVAKYIENATVQSEADIQFPRVIANKVQDVEVKMLFQEYAQNIIANPVIGIARPFLRDEYIIVLKIEDVKNAKLQDIRNVMYPLSFCDTSITSEEEGVAEIELKREKGLNTFTTIMEVKKNDTFVFLTEDGMKMK
ncbi:hypothetical protein [Candidatus Fokinia crypta]|uniref:Uncharacterized protein n=1 Tax=Candidatus Fokinia crypta TaxID=1920990 RepID=A0ABZ0URS7_9RICK|nr:hypothetical protein [Candidatus Fokinia cryptica]WPX97590.1 hypothetical protein Fokcrypt_00095 [Candidatus Fokinia cryptica]